MAIRLHSGGRFRTWLGARFGGDFELGDRVYRRLVHCLGAFAVVYYVVPTGFFVVLPKEYVLLLALAAVVVLEVLRHVRGIQLPTMREYEVHRVASYVFYSAALVAAILFFPAPVGGAVILGTALIDPLAGELRNSRDLNAAYPVLPGLAYVGLATFAFLWLGSWAWIPAFGLAALTAGIALAVERPKMAWVDDDLWMTIVPAIVLTIVIRVWPALPYWMR